MNGRVILQGISQTTHQATELWCRTCDVVVLPGMEPGMWYDVTHECPGPQLVMRPANACPQGCTCGRLTDHVPWCPSYRSLTTGMTYAEEKAMDDRLRASGRRALFHPGFAEWA